MEAAHTTSGPVLWPGTQLLHRYELVESLARGGMGVVWRARHLALGSDVAIKFAHPGGEETGRQVFHEARIAASLGSPHIVQVHDLGEHDGFPFLVMELLRGETLQEHLRAHGRLSPAQVLALATQLTRGLSTAHEAGVIHRDLKPSNIFLVRNGDESLCKLLDFGVARCSESNRTQTGDFVGTPRYVSPEQAANAKGVDLKSDLWSLSLVIFECLVGRSPHHGKTSFEILRTVGLEPLPSPSSFGVQLPGLDAWFERATRKDIEQRFSTAEEQFEALREILAASDCDATIDSSTEVTRDSRLETSEPSLPPPPSRSLVVRRTPKKAWGKKAAVGGGLIILLAGATGAFLASEKWGAEVLNQEREPAPSLDGPSSRLNLESPVFPEAPSPELSAQSFEEDMPPSKAPALSEKEVSSPLPAALSPSPAPSPVPSPARSPQRKPAVPVSKPKAEGTSSSAEEQFWGQRK